MRLGANNITKRKSPALVCPLSYLFSTSRLKMANSESSVSQTIIYLRPQTPEANGLLNLMENKPYRFEVAPLPDPADISFGGVPNLFPTPNHSALLDQNRVSRESTPGLYPIFPTVFRLEFTSVKKPSPLGFELGYGSNSNVRLAYFTSNQTKGNIYFRIHYNFDSGALLTTALDKIKVGTARLKAHDSLLLMPGMSIFCGGRFEFAIEFPSTINCVKEHERNYQRYAAMNGFPDAQYLPTPLAEFPPIGAEHKSLAILGKGAFGEVHQALSSKTGAQLAIKILNGGGESEMKEVKIMSGLSHVSYFVFVSCHILTLEKENIIKYQRAFKLPSGKTCIVMELAVTDLYSYLEARKKGEHRSYLSLPCIQSICRQALLGFDYLHNQGIMHRDIKPQNILVTKWDVKTDTPIIRLADFGLAGINAEHRTFCGTEGYVAPEVIKRAEQPRKQKDRVVNTVASDRLHTYTNAVDIWSLERTLQALVLDVPQEHYRRV